MPAGPSFSEAVTPTDQRGSYALNGRIHVGLFGHPDGEPLTTGPADMKPSWSKEGDLLVFFRLTKPAPRIPDWKTAICVVKADGTGFRKLTDATHTDFNPTWTRAGSNLVVFNRRNPDTGGYVVMLARPDGRPGEEYVVSDARYHTYAYSCLKDGRMFVSSSRQPSKGGYFLMRPDREGRPEYEPVECGLAAKGRLDRVSITPDETMVCFEFQQGFGEYRYPGRALYMYRLNDGSTIRVSADPKGNYMFPHGEATPK